MKFAFIVILFLTTAYPSLSASSSAVESQDPVLRRRQLLPDYCGGTCTADGELCVFSKCCCSQAGCRAVTPDGWTVYEICNAGSGGPGPGPGPIDLCEEHFILAIFQFFLGWLFGEGFFCE